MIHLSGETRLSQKIVATSTRTDRPLFFAENGTDWDYSQHVEIPLSTELPTIAPIQGHTHGVLRSLFKKRIRQNEHGLSLAFVNRHDASHMDRVANGTFHAGIQLGMPMREVQAATLAARFHDVGYEFPNNAELADIERLGKDLHTQHAPTGADLVTDALKSFRRADAAVRAELQNWTDETFQIAHEAIRLHSNDVGTDDNANPVTLLPRFIDKIDNTNMRVRPEHLEAFHTAAFRTVQHIQQRVERGCRRVLTSEVIPNGKRHGLSLTDVRDRLKAVDPYYFHRVVPAAITDQRLFLNPANTSAVLEYRVYPSIVGDALRVDYGNKDHLEDFFKAYDRSMLNAANVLRILRKHRGAPASADDTLLTVRLIYEDGKQSVLNYGSDSFV